MNKRIYSPIHDFWHRRVEGQIRSCIRQHPEYFTNDPALHETIVNSLAKRIVGEIVVVESSRPTIAKDSDSELHPSSGSKT